MTDAKKINSDAYWDSRFAENWEEFEGPAQSRFFSRLAISNLPRWLLNKLKQEALIVADWGCAQGDGTDVWASYIEPSQLVGVDFSTVAIEQAAHRYPSIRFLCEDWLNNQGDERFDVVFSSNTLEHFHKPYTVLETICHKAKKAVILALPYQELDRIEEHFYTFLPENIPVVLENGFRLVWSKVIDCRRLPSAYWHGSQIILVYADPAWLDSHSLVLLDHQIESSDITAEMTRLNNALLECEAALRESGQQLVLERETASRESGEQLATVTQALRNVITQRENGIAERHAIYAKYETIVTERAALETEKAELIEERQALLMERDSALALVDAIRHSRSWKITRPIRFVCRLIRYGLQNDDIRVIKTNLRPIYRYFRPATEAQVHSPSDANGTMTIEDVNIVNEQNDRLTSSQVSATRPPFGLAPRGQFPDYIFFGVIDWHLRHQRPQHLALELATKGRRVFYVSANLVDEEKPGFNIEQLDSSGRVFKIELYAKGSPVIYSGVPDLATISQLRESIGEVLKWARSTKIVSLIQHPFWAEIATVLPNSRVVYDCMDHHDGFGNTAKDLLAVEHGLFRNVDLTITTSAWLDQFVARYTDRRTLIRNAGEYAHFAKVPEQIYVEPHGRKIIGYYGAIAEWFDVELVEAIAQRFTDCCILLIGADTVEAKAHLAHLPNVEFTGELPYTQLPYYLHSFDVCLLPFKVIPLTLATNPVKVYEYLCAGKPVVTVDLPEMSQFDGLISVGKGTEDFLSAVADALNDPGSPDVVNRRREFAEQQTWAHRVETLLESIETKIPTPKVSVIVVTYNNLDLTRACLTSLDKYSDYDNLEIIVVDNASIDGSKNFLQQWAAEAPNRHLILNNDNRGFAAANNQGLAIATGDFLVLLNNDTYVTPGWIGTLVRHMQRDDTIGLIGPVTNNIGNEAKIDISYSSMEQMLDAAQNYTRKHIGKIIPLHTAAFFCVMMPRKVYEQVGGLDESYGRGFFEDDDYCRRVEQIGKRIVCAEDVFIHHHLSASFGKLNNIEKLLIFEINKARYEDKWGTWLPHSFR